MKVPTKTPTKASTSDQVQKGSHSRGPPVVSPTLFNVVVDAVVQENNRIMALTDNDCISYADGGLITVTDQAAVQFCINLISNLFSLFGLQMNANKTKALVGRPKIITHHISTAAFNRGHTYASNNRQLTTCNICGLEMQRKSIKRHLINQHQVYERPSTSYNITTAINTGPRTYTILLPNNNPVPTPCPVPNCIVSYSSRSSMQVRDLYLNVSNAYSSQAMH
jgi:Reverse transcriptase (RNA-dependent DNA polymerase)